MFLNNKNEMNFISVTASTYKLALCCFIKTKSLKIGLDAHVFEADMKIFIA